MRKTKLIKDCKVGDALFYVFNISFYSINYGSLNIYKRYIEEIIRGSEWDGGDTFKVKSYAGYQNEYHYEFKHLDSSHDSLIVDSDVAYDDKGKYYTSYEAAKEHILRELQSNVRQALEHLETAEMKLGLTKDNLFIKRTKETTIDYKRYKKVEIYDIPYFDHMNPNKVDKVLADKKYNVYKRYIATNGLGRVNYQSDTEYFVQAFDTLEEANEFMKENDKSYFRGENDWDFEGYRYYIKE